MRQQGAMCLCYLQVIRLDRDGIQHGAYELRALFPSRSFRHLHSDSQLRHRNRRHRDIVVVVDCRGE
jgi:hypothetical protein